MLNVLTLFMASCDSQSLNISSGIQQASIKTTKEHSYDTAKPPYGTSTIYIPEKISA